MKPHQQADGSSVSDEPRWHASVAVILSLILYITLPPRLTFGPLWLVPLLTLSLLIPLSIVAPARRGEKRLERAASIALIAIVNLANILSLALLIHSLASHGRNATGQELLLSAFQIWLTNVLVFGLWYWETDGGGPDARAGSVLGKGRRIDFLFPQLAASEVARSESSPPWRPKFFDYVFLSFCTATAFSPADTYPLTQTGKLLMMTEALVSFVTIAVIAARAINIIS
ncbi:MAG: hypothetical protein M3160_08730 [Candidatus Eremiobacteraeota bacterium]|nr:hypothetical protein [Candidatus Eremiobacteraeota bacterium]